MRFTDLPKRTRILVTGIIIFSAAVVFAFGLDFYLDQVQKDAEDRMVVKREEGIVLRSTITKEGGIVQEVRMGSGSVILVPDDRNNMSRGDTVIFDITKSGEIATYRIVKDHL